MNEILLYEHYLAMWNVRGLCDAESFGEMLRQVERHKIRVAAIQDIRWNGDKKNTYATEKYTVYYSGSDSMNMLGTGFVVDNRLNNNVLDFTPVNERICVLRMNYPSYNVTLLSVLAPSEETEVEKKDYFYHLLDIIYGRIPPDDIKMILGSLNAQVGRGRYFRPTIGVSSLHYKCNDNGTRLINFAKKKEMTLVSTYFMHKDKVKATYVSADGQQQQIDHCVVDRRHHNNIINIKSCRTAAFDSDHKLMRITYRHNITQAMKNKYFEVNAILEFSGGEVRERDEEEIRNSEQSSEEGSQYNGECESMLNKGNGAQKRMLQRNAEADKELLIQKRRFAKYQARGSKRHYSRRRYFNKMTLERLSNMEGPLPTK